MIKVKVFELEESGYQPNRYILRFHPDLFYTESTNGSFSVMAARIAGLPYTMYCRFCRDVLGAEVVGKGSMYPVVYFKKTPETLMFVRLLNSRANLVIWEKEHPNWKEHQEELTEYKKKAEAMRNVSTT